MSLLAAGLVTSPASAATAAATPITLAEAKSALTAALKATTSASAAGFTAELSMKDASGTMRISAVVDNVRHRASMTADGVTGYMAAGVGAWDPLSDANRRTLSAELGLLGQPGARYVLTADRKLSAADIRNALPWTPDSELSNAVSALSDPAITPADVAVTKTENANDTTYTLTSSMDGISFTETFVIATKDLTLTGCQHILGIRTAFTYGPQTVTLPLPGTYVTDAQMAAAKYAVANYNTLVKKRANEVAATAKKLAAKAKRANITTVDIRNAAKVVANAHRTDLVKVTTANVPGGVKLRAVNPKTHKPIAFTVTIKVGKANVRAA